ncbi:MAG TPA: 2-oxo acid dehydrogenase subunit E2 [Clostridiaceae bacterium]|nr:2-oxo acid dehydrogenase subunit E2 [Clostridiaceae bacterium]
MALFSKKRSDGELVRDGDPMNRIMPYIMRRRNESAVYYRIPLEITNARTFIRDNRKQGRRITLLNIITAAMLQTMYKRPRSNRFVAGRRLYQRKEFEVLLVVKESLSDDSLESVARVPFEADDNIFDVTEKMAKHIEDIQEGGIKADDKMIRTLSNAPRILNRTIGSLLNFLDFHNILPQTLRDILPFYSSLFISHLGSIGADAPFHHLYEFGTTSIFMTIGRSYLKPFRGKDNGVEWRRMVDVAVTIDERICDGYYLIKTLKTFENFVQHPELLTKPVERVDTEEDDLKDKRRWGRWLSRRFRRGEEDILSVDAIDDEEFDDLEDIDEVVPTDHE